MKKIFPSFFILASLLFLLSCADENKEYDLNLLKAFSVDASFNKLQVELSSVYSNGMITLHKLSGEKVGDYPVKYKQYPHADNATIQAYKDTIVGLTPNTSYRVTVAGGGYIKQTDQLIGKKIDDNYFLESSDIVELKAFTNFKDWSSKTGKVLSDATSNKNFTLDNQTKLIWQNLDATTSSLKYAAAEKLVASQKHFNSQFRFPSLTEMQSLYAAVVTNNQAVYFPTLKADQCYWINPNQCFDFSTGAVAASTADATHPVLPVF